VAKDEAEAVKWITLAAAQGNERAKADIPLIESNMQQNQIAEGKRRANDWLEKWKKAYPTSGSQP
jgi:TPR repeat protein